MGNIDTSTLLWIVGTLFVVISGLIGAIYALIWSAIKDLRASIKNLQTKTESDCATKCGDMRDKLDAVQKDCSDRGRAIYEKIEAERKERIDKHDAAMDRVFKKVDGNHAAITQEVKDVRERVEDLRETVSSFGSIYVTRRELLRDRGQGG